MTRPTFDIRQSGRTIVTVLLIGLVANVAAWLAIVRPTVERHRMLVQESDPQIKELVRREREVGQREAFLESLRAAENDLATLRQDVLSSKQRRLVTVQLELAKLAQRFRINLRRVRYSTTYLEREGLEHLAMVVPLEGGYANLRSFIQAVESSDKFLLIESVVLDEAKDGGSLLQLNITLGTYFNNPELLKEGAQSVRRRRGA